MSRGFSSYTNSTITVVVGGSYTGDGINGWAGGTSYSFACKGRRTPLQRPREDTTDSGYSSGVPGPIAFKVELNGYFKSDTGSGPPTIPPVNLTDAFIKVVITIGFSLTGVILVEGFDPSGIIGTAQGWSLSGTTDGTFTYA